MQLAQSSCTTQARKCIDRYRIPEHTAWIPRRPALPESRDGVSPWPPSLPPNSARANKSFHALHGDWAESVLGAETHGGNAARPWLGTRGPTHPCRPEIRDMQHRNLRRETVQGGRRMLSFWFVVVRQPQTHPDSRRPNVKSSTGTCSKTRAQPTCSLGLLVSRHLTTGHIRSGPGVTSRVSNLYPTRPTRTGTPSSLSSHRRRHHLEFSVGDRTTTHTRFQPQERANPHRAGNATSRK